MYELHCIYSYILHYIAIEDFGDGPQSHLRMRRWYSIPFNNIDLGVQTPCENMETSSPVTFKNRGMGLRKSRLRMWTWYPS